MAITKRNCNKRQCHSNLWWLSQRNGFPCTVKFNTFNKHFFSRFCDVFVDTVHDTNPRTKKQLCFETKIQSRYQCNNVIYDGGPSHPRLGRCSCFHEFTVSPGMSSSLGGVCSRQCLHIIKWFFFKCNAELSVPNSLHETSVRALFG